MQNSKMKLARLGECIDYERGRVANYFFGASIEEARFPSRLF